MIETTNNQPTNRTCKYIITNRIIISRKNKLNLGFFYGKPALTLTLFHTLKSEQYFNNNNKKEPQFGLIFVAYIIYYIIGVVDCFLFCSIDVDEWALLSNPLQLIGGSFFG